MKIRFIALCFGALLLPVMGLATMASMLNQMPTKQEMHIAKTAKPQAKVEVDATDDAAQMAKVKAIMARDKKTQSAKSLVLPHKDVAAAQQDMRTPAHTTVVTTTTGQPSQALQAVQNLKQRLVTLNQEMILFQQRSDQKIETLANNMQMVMQREAQLTKAMQLLNQELVRISSAKETLDPTGAQHASSDAGPTAQPVQSHNNAASFSNMLSRYGYYLLIFVLLVLLAYYCRLSIKNKKAKAHGLGTANDDTEGEYDFLGSEEGITAKLNLARSYLAMGDYDQMRQVLGEVMQQGDTQQQAEAQDLLKKIV